MEATEWSEFVATVNSDEYAEFHVADDLVLTANWEADGSFNPYVQPTGERSGQEYEDAVKEALEEYVTVQGVEWAESGVYYTY